jgi:hypothetical protein
MKILDIYHNLLIGVYLSIVLVSYCLIFSPMIGRVSRETLASWNLMKMIPQDNSAQFTKLSGYIKEHKDNLKWQ